MAAPGDLIADRYRLVSQIGAGGMGVVWEATDVRLNRQVAVKQLRIQPGSTVAESDLITQRAMREARINARLQHPYAVAVFDVVDHEGRPCLVMELVPSMPLTAVIRELGAVEPTEAARVGAQVAAALAAAHALGIVHRDVKPGNVLIGDDGTARICDFGISRSFGDTTLTLTGMITGTPAYLAPEVAKGEEATFASDVFSLGATLYAAVEGEPPFGSDGNAMAVLYRVVAGELRPAVRAGALTPLLVAMMSPGPADRPTMADTAARLQALSGGSGPAPPLVSRPVSPSTPLLGTPAPPVAADPGPVTRPLPVPAAPAPAPAERGSADWAPTPQAPPPAPPNPSEPSPPRRSGRVLVGVLVALALLAAGFVVVPQLGRWIAGSGSDPDTTTPSRSAGPTPSTQPSSPATDRPTAAELAQAVTDYYALLPDDSDTAWTLLTPSYQQQAGGRDAYDDFWNDIDTVTATQVRGTLPDSVQATITYVAKSGNQRSVERRSFRLLESDGVLRIDQSSVI